MESRFSSASEFADLAEQLRQEGRLHEGLEVVERCLKESPGHPRGLLLQSRILYLAGMYAQSLRILGSLEQILGSKEGLRKIKEGLEGLWQEPRPKIDPAFVTETMAELHIKQGYVWEAMEIYRQLYVASPQGGLWQKILQLRSRLEPGVGETDDGKADERLEALDRWIENQPRDS